MSSCSNDDIPVTMTGETVFKINPETVMKPFKEYNVGDLDMVLSGCKLRVRLLVYNPEGSLVNKVEEKVTSYVSKVQANMLLEQGKYRAVVITDVVSDENQEYWTLSDEATLTSAKIKDAGFLGGQNEVLGIGSLEFSVGESLNEIQINPNPAGALLCLTWYNMQSYTSIKEVTLENNRVADYLVMNGSGNYDVAVKNNANQYSWRTWFISPFEENIDNGYNYNFVLPMSNISYRYRIDFTDDTHQYSDEYNLNIKAGEEYLFYCNLKDENNNDYWVTNVALVNGDTKSRVINEIEGLHPFKKYLSKSVKLSSLIKLN